MSKRDNKSLEASISSSEQGDGSDEIGSTDVLVGRGYQYENHPGNIMFYQEIDAAMEEYHGVAAKKQKSMLVNRIYNTLTSTGRFIQRMASNGHYRVVEEKVAKQKISHALRYRRQMIDTTPQQQVSAPGEATEAQTEERQVLEDEEKRRKRAKFRSDLEYIHSQGPRILTRSDSDDLNWDAMSWPELQEALGQPEEYLQSTDAAVSATVQSSQTSTTTEHTTEYTTEAAYVSESTNSVHRSGRSSVTESQQANDSLYYEDNGHSTQEKISTEWAMSGSYAYPFASLDVGIDELSPVDSDSPEGSTTG